MEGSLRKQIASQIPVFPKEPEGAEMVKEAIVAAGGKATSFDIRTYVNQNYPTSSVYKTWSRGVNILKKWEEVEQLRDKQMKEIVYVLKATVCRGA